MENQETFNATHTLNDERHHLQLDLKTHCGGLTQGSGELFGDQKALEDIFMKYKALIFYRPHSELIMAGITCNWPHANRMFINWEKEIHRTTGKFAIKGKKK